MDSDKNTSSSAQRRPPVVAVLGHVDHGKTTLLDAIRQTEVAAGEHGGITQHIGAYQVTIPYEDDGEKTERTITFIDTPGHAAFTRMRARGAQATDIAILVVAANDGVMPQTEEAINHIKAADVSMIVVVNKIDLAEANPSQVYQQLAEHEVLVEPYGGDVPAVELSALKKEGVEDLLEMIVLIADLEEYRSDPDGELTGVVIESGVDAKKGPVATVLVQNGTLRVSDTVYAGSSEAKVKALTTAQGERVDEAGPSMPVEVLGFNEPVETGSTVSRKRTESETKAAPQHVSQGPSFSWGEEEEELKIILRTDVEGTKEAIVESLKAIEPAEGKIAVMQAGTGDVTESDIFLAQASDAIILAFNVRVPAAIERLADREDVIIRSYNIIYKLLEDIEEAAHGLGELKIDILGKAEVLKEFKGTEARIAGIKVTEGRLAVKDPIRIERDGSLVTETRIDTMKQVKEEVKTTRAGSECGITFQDEVAFRPGDIVKSYRNIK